MLLSIVAQILRLAKSEPVAVVWAVAFAIALAVIARKWVRAVIAVEAGAREAGALLFAASRRTSTSTSAKTRAAATTTPAPPAPGGRTGEVEIEMEADGDENSSSKGAGEAPPGTATATAAPAVVPISVNYHFTHRCNKACGFSFHTAKTSHILSEEQAQRGLALLQRAGMRKINFAGGEPFLYPHFLGRLARFCKQQLRLEAVSVVTNGSRVTRAWFGEYGAHVDILAVSCDSFDERTNVAIGRGGGGGGGGGGGDGEGGTVEQLFRIAEWCAAYGVRFKLNTVVCRLNVDEDMGAVVQRLRPFRWKCFQVLLVPGENDGGDGGGGGHNGDADTSSSGGGSGGGSGSGSGSGDGGGNSKGSNNGKRIRGKRIINGKRRATLRDAEFARFCARHAHLACLVPEANRVMAQSYLILDEYMRFLDKGGDDDDGVGQKQRASASILEVGVARALAQIRWDKASFDERGGEYDWSRAQGEDSGGSGGGGGGGGGNVDGDGDGGGSVGGGCQGGGGQAVLDF